MSCRSNMALSLSRTRSLFRAREGVRTAALLSLSGSLLLALSACESPSSTPPAEIAYFAESGSEYAIGPVIASLNEYDERGMFAGIGAILGVDTGYVVADGLNHQLVLLDKQLNPLRTMGRQGEGPGEYQFPSRLARDGDHVAVLDVGLGRVSYLTEGGDFTRSLQVTGNLQDLAAHPELGLLVAGDAFPDHYLARVTDDEQTGFARIPDVFRVHSDWVQLRNDLVAVTPDGTVHVLDGRQLALVSYDSTGSQTGLVYLPEEARASIIERIESLTESFGGPRTVLGVQAATTLQSLADGRLFVRVTSGNAIGFVLDLDSREAIPITVPSGNQWTQSSGATTFFDGERLVFTEGMTGVMIAETEFVVSRTATAAARQ